MKGTLAYIVFSLISVINMTVAYVLATDEQWPRATFFVSLAILCLILGIDAKRERGE